MAKTKRLILEPVIGIEGGAIRLPTYNDDGSPVLEDVFEGEGKQKKLVGKKLITKEANIIGLLELLIRNFPRERLTMENITHATRLKGQLIEGKEAGNCVLVIEETEHTWVKKMLQDEAVGPKTYGMDLFSVIKAMDNFERKHKSLEKVSIEEYKTHSKEAG